MKNILFICLLLLCTLSAFGNRILFASKDQTVWFEVELLKNDLVVKSNKFRRQQIFYPVQKNLYENRLGARIIVLDDDKIQYDDPNHRLKFNLYRDKSYEPIINPGVANGRGAVSSLNTQQLEGTWFAKELNKKLALLSTREGFKIKFSGSVNWVDFTYDKINDKFADQKGNYYVFSSLNMADWISSDRSQRVVIEKISDTVEY